MTGGGAWLPRTYLYVATFIGLVTLLTGSSTSSTCSGGWR